jgi:hypothetical protein
VYPHSCCHCCIQTLPGNLLARLQEISKKLHTTTVWHLLSQITNEDSWSLHLFGVFICFLAESIYDSEIELKISNEDSWSLYLFLIILSQKTNEDFITSEIESMRRKKNI